MSETIHRTGAVTITTTTNPGRQATTLRVHVDISEYVAELVEAIAQVRNEAPDALGRALDDIVYYRAETQQAAGDPSAERESREKLRDAIDELLSLADVAPDPSVALGGDAVHAITMAHSDALMPDWEFRRKMAPADPAEVAA